MRLLASAAESAINFLRVKHHPEKPHISALSPLYPRDYWLIWEGARPKKYDEEEAYEDEALEDIEESLRSKPSGWVMGADFRMEEEVGSARACFTFYVRLRPDYDDECKWDESAYAKVQLELDYERIRLRGRLAASASAALRLSQRGAEPEEKSVRVDPAQEFVAVAVVPQSAVGRLRFDSLREVLRRAASVGLGRWVQDVDLRLITVGSDLLTAEVFDKNGESRGAYHHAFCALVGYSGGIFKAYLINLGGVSEDASEDPLKVYTYNANDGFSRWALGYLLETEGRVRFSGWRPSAYWDGHGLNGAYPINTLLIESGPCEYELRDYLISEEELVQIKRSKASPSDFLGQIAEGIKGADARVHIFMRALSAALHDANPALRSLYAYQEEATREILASLGLLEGGKRRAIAVEARTAGGKTIAFLVPALISIFCEKARAERPGVKAILMYPTKALANDQLEEVAHLLFYLTERLRETGLATEITFGCLHGNVYDADEMRKLISMGREPLLPVKCPDHDASMGLRLDGKGALAFCPGGANCRFARFLNESMRKTREEVYFAPPDILITDEDMVNRILSGAPKRHRAANEGALWYEWQLLGYPYKRCKVCLHTYPEAANIRKCAVCGSDAQASVETIREVSKPSIVVLDEAHQLFGSFGVQVRHMLSLLELALRSKPTYVLASATLGKAKDFAAGLLGVQPSEVRDVVAETEAGAGERAFRRAFALVMPKAYTRDATLARLLSKFHEEFVRRIVEGNKPPRGIVFTNTLPESNEVLQQLRNELAGSLRVDGHSTDFNEERVNKELDFKAGKIDWFVATSTLELGIDYGVVDFVTIYGVPPKVTSFVQRVGRAGRGRDAVVFIVFDPESPINYSYYENYKVLCDGSIRDKAIECEVMPVGTMNKEAVRRAVRRWAVSEVYRACSSGAAPAKIITDGLGSPSQRSAEWQRIAGSLKARIPSGLPASLAALYTLYRQVIDGEVSWLEQKAASEGSGWRDVSDFVNSLGRYALYDLRAADETIEICYTPLGDVDRLRELRYAIRHGLWGQLTSFRGHFFTVTAVDVEEKRDIKEWLKVG